MHYIVIIQICQNSSIKPTMDNKNIKNRLFQTLQNRSPKNHPFLLEEETNQSAATLRPKKLQDISSPSHGKLTTAFKQGKLILNPFTSPEIMKKRPQEVEQEKLSKEAKSLVEQTKNRIRNNLKPHDIFQLYDNFPEMIEDFFYLNRIDHPYDYQIVTYAQRDSAQYMTISSQGVTLYHDKEAEFMTREEWCIDEKRYYALQKIYFFKQYKLSKNFRIWKNRMRRHYIREMERILNQNLFLAIKYPRQCLLQIKFQTYTLRDSLNFFPYQSLERLTPQGFTQLLDEYRQKTLLKNIKQITQNITRELQSAVIEEINKFKQQNNIKIQGVNQKHTGNKQGFVYSQQAILKKQYKRVYKLIKLADSMLQQAKIQMVFRCLQQLIQKIRQLQHEDKQPWITCTASIQQNGSIRWEPDCESLIALFLDAIKKHIKQLNENNQKIISNPIFNKYRFADSAESKTQELQSRNSLKMLIEQSPNYFLLLQQIESTLEQQFKTTTKEEAVIQKFIDIYTRHKQLATITTIFKQNNGVQLCNFVQQWKKEDKLMSELSQEKKGKLLLYNYSQLRKNVVNIPKQTLSNFFTLLPEETNIRCKQIITQSKNLLQSISLYPTQILSFAKFNKAVRLAAERLEDIRSSGSQICLLVDLLGKNKLGNIDLYNTKKIEVLNSISALKSKVEESQAKQNESLSKFKKDNQGEIIKIKSAVKDLANRFNAIDFYQVKATTRQMKEILAKIKEILPSVSSLENQSLKITEIQIDLNLPQTDFNQVHSLYENVKLVNDIWTCRQQWKNLLLSLYHKHYCEVDCEEVKRKWQEFNTQVTNLTKLLPQNETLKNISQQLSEVEVLIDTIAALRSPNLQQKSWREISEYLAYELGIQNQADFPFSNIKHPSYTVKWLLEINIPVYKEKIQFIVRKSLKEKELSAHLAEYKNYIIGGINFQTIQKKNQFYIFAQNREISMKIHQNLTHLFAMLDNQYSTSIRNEAETLIKHYEYVQEIMKAVFQFGYHWSRYQNFFDANSSSLKLLTKESKQFAGWETQWKKIIKNITDSPTFYRKVYQQTLGNSPSRATIKLIAKTNTAIDQVRKGLQEYLQRKRSNFPRYYFIPDEKLLHMLANIDPKEPITASFVPIIYKNIQKIIYKQDTKDTLLGIISKDGEEFNLKNINFKVQSQMEEIFKAAEEQIRKRISYLIKNIFVKYSDEEISRQNMILQNSTQIILAIDSIAWVRLAEQTYLCPEPIGDLYDWIEIQQDQIQQLKSIIKKPQTRLTQRKLLQLLCQSLYFVEKTENLLKNNITSTQSYQWDRIPKIMMANNNADIFLKQFHCKLNYCYQFLGNNTASYIQPETERVWINLVQALIVRQVVCLQSGIEDKLETVKELGYLIAQEVQSLSIGEKTNFKMIQRYINGSLYTGHWTIFNAPSSQKMLMFLANQLNHVKKILLDNSLQKTKGTINYSPNSAFFLSFIGQGSSQLDKLVAPLAYRNIKLMAPSWHKICSILVQSKMKPTQISSKVVNICEVMRQCFELSYCQLFSFDFVQNVLQRAVQVLPSYEWLKSIKCKQNIQYVIFQILDQKLLSLLRKDDSKIYEALKTSIIPDYQKIRIRHPSNYNSKLLAELTKFIETKHNYNKKNTEYLQVLQLFVKAANSSHIGIILSGKPLSGKTHLIQNTAQFIREQTKDKITLNRIYHKAYSNKDCFPFQKSAFCINQSLNQTHNRSWVVIDGAISDDYIQLLGKYAQNYMIPQVGIIQPSPKLKFISQSYDTSKITPNIVGSHAVIWLGESLTSENMIRQLFAKLALKGYLVNLHNEAIQWLVNSLIMTLTKLQNKTILKSKPINFLYPLNNLQITFRCCRLIQSVFAMNWQSIRDKQKNMKKIIDRFVSWALYWCLIGIVFVQDEPKLQKSIMEIAKIQTNYAEQLGNCIIYPNCGLEVQPLNGLRTQSSMSIPQKGIITNLLRSDLIPESEATKNNKFFEEIVISQALLIRVNYSQSNKLNYLWQISQHTATAMLVVGPQNSGKKSVVQLLAKNMRAKSQFYSIRYRNRQVLSSQIQKPFRKLNGLDGTVLKSMSASKKLLICIEDVTLDNRNIETCELFRMIFNEKGYYNKTGQWMTISDSSFCLIAQSFATQIQQLRLLPHFGIFQTASNSSEKLHSIYYPYLKNWAAFNGLSGDVERIFGSEAGDTLLDAILSIYKLFEDMHKASSDSDTVESWLMKPRIGDIGKVLGYICRTPLASHYNMSYYYQLWAHETVRVFGDRLYGQKQNELFFKQIKKQALVKFKENFNLNQQTMFNFTSLGVENQNCYIRIEDPAYLHNYISNLLQAQEITLPLKFLFDELLEYLLKIFRVIALQGAHMLLISHNAVTAGYLIQLACQISQNDFYKLNKELINVEKHIQPTLYFKQAVCISEKIENLNQQSIYQISCLLNSNVYDFAVKGEMKDKIKANLNKKQKIQLQKKQTKMFGRAKTQLLKVQQKQEDIDALMAEQFMSLVHFVFQASPSSPQLKPFLKRQSNIVGKLHFSWIDMPIPSLTKVAKQILSFDQEINQLTLQYNNDEKCIQKARKIYESLNQKERYFNDFLAICDIVKSESVRIGQQYQLRQRQLRDGRENMKKVKNCIAEKEQVIKNIHQELEQTNNSIQLKAKELQQINNQITQWQINTSNQEASNENLIELKLEREQKQIDLKILREKKDKLQPQKKKILKNIKIAEDYLQIFNNSYDYFDKCIEQTTRKALLLQDKLIILWSAIFYLSKVPAPNWISRINSWFRAISSLIPQLIDPSDIIQIIDEFSPHVFLRFDLFDVQLQFKVKALFLILQFYEQTSMFGKIIRVYDPKGILALVLQKMTGQLNKTYSLIKNYQRYTKQAKSQIQTLIKSRIGLVLIEKNNHIDDLQACLLEKKMSNYFNKIIVLSNLSDADVSLQCNTTQLQYTVEDLTLKLVNPRMQLERVQFFQEYVKQVEKRRENELLLFRACASINIQTQTYIEEVSKYKSLLNSADQAINNIIKRLEHIKYAQFAQFQVVKPIAHALSGLWSLEKVNFKSFNSIYQLAVFVRYSNDFEQLSLQEKQDLLSKIVQINLGEMKTSNLKEQISYSKRWPNNTKILVLNQSKELLQSLQKKFKMVNLLSMHYHNPPTTEHISYLAKIYYNFIPQLHSSQLIQLIQRDKVQKEDITNSYIPLIVMSDFQEIKSVFGDKLAVISMEDDFELTLSMQQSKIFLQEKTISVNIHKYLSKTGKSIKIDQGVLEYFENYDNAVERQNNIVKYISEATDIKSAELIKYLLHANPGQLGQQLQKINCHIKDGAKRRHNTIYNKIQPNNVKDQLPFSFNLIDFMPSKDILATEIISQCVSFNQRLKEIKDNLKESQYDWEACQKNQQLTSQMITDLNLEFQSLKKNLLRMHIIPTNSLSNTNKSAVSSHSLSNHNIHFQNVLNFPTEMVTPRLLNLLKCRAAKKLKTSFFNIGISWKLSTTNFTFEDAFTSYELCMIAQGRVFDDFSVLTGQMERNEEEKGFVELMICPVDSAHLPKGSGSTVFVPIYTKYQKKIGCIQVNKSDVNAQNVLGFSQVRLQLE